MMKQLFTVVLSVASAIGAVAQENRLPQKAAQRYAKLCTDHIGLPFVGQITSNVDVTKPCATRGEGGGAMVVPEKKLSKKTLLNAGKKVVPIGQLWLRKWAPAIDGKPAAKKRLRIITVSIDDKDRPMALLLLGIRKARGKALELVVFAKSNKPLIVAPLKTVEFVQSLPIEMEWQRGEKQVDDLNLTIMGRAQVTLKVTGE